MTKVIFYEVVVSEFPSNEDIMFGLCAAKRFSTFEDAKKCADVWKSQFKLTSKIYKTIREEVSV